ncbi:MAG: hypothetical protein JW909_06445 [Planctomycetes bacterium]|nr:hypothetical protein [Planctomycetota bacterium]
MKNHRRRTAGDERGITIVMVLIVALVLTMAATAFMVLANVETRALNYKAVATRTELVAESGLSHAIAVINEVHENLADDANLVATPDGVWDMDPAPGALDAAALSWATFFRDGAEEREVVPKEVFNAYGDEDYGDGTKARDNKATVFEITQDNEFGQAKVVADYCVLVCDMDGRMHVNPDFWMKEGGVQAKKILEVITDALTPVYSPPTVNKLIGDAGSATWHSFGELAAYCSLDTEQTDALRPYMTPYPVIDLATTPPRLNVNTARRLTMEAILEEIPSLGDAERTAVAEKLTSARPFRDRRSLERALEELAPEHQVVGEGANVGTGDITEKQFNDVLNSLNSAGNPDAASIFSNDADYTAGDPAAAIEGAGGVYEFDFNPYTPPDPEPVPPHAPPYANTGGEKTRDSDTTWGCEVVFTSRFYEILVLGRGWRLGSDPDAGRGRALQRLLWAVYDAQDKKVVWKRWLLPSDR